MRSLSPMRTWPLLLVIAAGCANQVEPAAEDWRSQPLPLECQVETKAACFVPPGVPAGDDDCLVCPQSDGTLWFFQDPEWGSEHFQADFNTRICRIWGNGAWATGPTEDQKVNGQGPPYFPPVK